MKVPRHDLASAPRILAAALAGAALLGSATATGQEDVDEDSIRDDDFAEAPVAEAPSLHFGVALGGMLLAEMDGLNRHLAAAGLPELSTIGAVVEPRLELRIGRVVVPVAGRILSVSEALGSKLDVGGMLIGLGYDALADDGLSLYPTMSFGILRSHLATGLSRDLPVVPSFDAVLARTAGPVEMSRLTVVGEIGLGFDWTFARVQGDPARGIYLGGRLALTAALTDTAWALDGTGEEHVELPDGPGAPVSGPLAAFAFGVRL